jgi:hypothetical protein
MIATKPQVEPGKRLTFDKVNRRTHLYAALFFLPWFFVYGISSAVFNHPKWFDTGSMQWKPLFDREYSAEPSSASTDLRALGGRILLDNGLDGQFMVRRTAGGMVEINQNRFLSNRQITYNPESHHLTARQSVVHWQMVLTRLHTRGGFEAPGFLQHLWSVIVDVIQAAMLVWIASGLYMWWHLKRFRKWGLLALGAGMVLFTAFLLGL